MEVITKKQFLDSYLSKIKKGAVFVYPTDTIYGIGCDATNTKAVKKLRLAKKRPTKPLSVIAPSKKWIKDNCVVSKKAERWINKLPGKYTLIFELKNNKCVSKEVNKSKKTIGIRIPKHWISQAVAKVGKPIITTSVNIADEEYMTSLNDMDEKIKKKIDFVIDSGKLKSRPSILVDLIQEKIEKR